MIFSVVVAPSHSPAQSWLAAPLRGAVQNPSAKVAKAQEYLESQRWDLAVQQLRSAVDDRDPDAQYLLGWCQANGKGVPRSLLDAEQSFFGAAQRKHFAAMYSLGRLRIDTAQPGSSKRVASGIQSLKDVAALGMGAAMRRLGQIYRSGIPGSLKPDLVEAQSWFQKAGAAGDAESLYHQGEMLEDGESGKADPAAALALYNKAAANGSTSAMVKLGVLAQSGSKPDRELAMRWFEKAAALQSLEGHHRLGKLLQASDPRKAVEEFRLAAQEGYAPALVDYGIAQEEGVGTSKDIAGAVKAYQEAAEAGDPVGLFRLAICYEQGLGIRKDQNNAFESFQLSGQAGYAEAQYRMGKGYASGVVSVKDHIAAAAWFQLGAAQGHAPSQCALGEIYETTAGALQDPDAAFELYRSAAGQGYAEAWFRLGRMVETGKAVAVNLEAAYYLYLGASQKGYSEAEGMAGSVARRLTPAVVKAVEKNFNAAPDQLPNLR
ncbi:MAG: sel1 repeat family protein [Verrucomicrobiae bacterium]|nr:sel1 repeat family protein [Verrucomicrobiae bacterium]